MLTMNGSSCGTLHPNSINLPLLESLAVMLEDPRSLLVAIVTPKLGYFACSPLKLTTRWSGIFTDLSDRFPTVQHLCLRHPRSSLKMVRALATLKAALCPLQTAGGASSICPSKRSTTTILELGSWNDFALEDTRVDPLCNIAY
ncbi:hypothetical protein BKA82DRAFT_174595 [Pisolithus tinctorius]|uniref:Uncharacterized protein n=1 Tax=Pisolithus tinctorius Marx 270 TaxID=870435 RepID=A0A0C3PJW5_PISTI|nr:hypothetical protein BKA82DRAFT_174595 [Pisolithus tinctorius]KIO14480.1 hypothetical protein M404DRAFT_174595 [Pisolithus tinctorius Marx 270]